MVFSQNLPFSKVRLIFKVDFIALKIQNLKFCHYKYAYLLNLLWFVSCNRKETRPQQPWTMEHWPYLWKGRFCHENNMIPKLLLLDQRKFNAQQRKFITVHVSYQRSFVVKAGKECMSMCKERRCILYISNDLHWICVEFALNLHWICAEFALNIYFYNNFNKVNYTINFELQQ